MKNIVPALFFSLVLFSCTKEQSDTDSSTNSMALLQHVWILDSVMIYADSNVFGDYLFASHPSDLQYEDFRTDGKVYTYGGSPTVYYDTSVYKLLSDNTTLLAYPIENGVTSASADTGYILKLTDHALMYWTKNSVGDYGRWVLKR